MSEKSKQLKQMEKSFLKMKRQYELEHGVVREILCDDCANIESCKRTKQQHSCKLYMKGVDSNGVAIQSNAHSSGDTNTVAA